MTGGKTLFLHLLLKGMFVSYGDNNKGNIMDSGTIDKCLNPTIEDILLVESLKHNLINNSYL